MGYIDRGEGFSMVEIPAAKITSRKVTPSVANQQFQELENSSLGCHTVDGGNPKQPPGMYKTL